MHNPAGIGFARGTGTDAAIAARACLQVDRILLLPADGESAEPAIDPDGLTRECRKAPLLECRCCLCRTGRGLAQQDAHRRLAPARGRAGRRHAAIEEIPFGFIGMQAYLQIDEAPARVIGLIGHAGRRHRRSGALGQHRQHMPLMRLQATRDCTPLYQYRYGQGLCFYCIALLSSQAGSDQFLENPALAGMEHISAS